MSFGSRTKHRHDLIMQCISLLDTKRYIIARLRSTVPKARENPEMYKEEKSSSSHQASGEVTGRNLTTIEAQPPPGFIGASNRDSYSSRSVGACSATKSSILAKSNPTGQLPPTCRFSGASLVPIMVNDTQHVFRSQCTNRGGDAAIMQNGHAQCFDS